MRSAQDTFASMLREDIAPRLRDLGFKGSGRAFTLADDNFWVTIAFQKSTYSTRDVVRFTAKRPRGKNASGNC